MQDADAPAGGMSVSALRALFPIVGERSYLYSGALAPAAQPVQAALAEWVQDWAHDPITCYDGFEPHLAALRVAFAELIGAAPDEIAVADNTSRASNLVIALLATRPGSNVVVDDTTYPSSIYPWLTMTGHELRVAHSADSADPLDAISALIDDQTVAVCVSHVAPETGFRHELTPLAEAAHAHGALLVVDAAQTTGVLPIDVQAEHVDALVTTTMKWMLGLPGVGLAYVARDVLANGSIQQVGYAGIDLPMNEDWPRTTLPPLVSDSRRLELGIPALPALAPCTAGIELLSRFGIERVHQRVEQLVTRLREGLIDAGAEVRAPHSPSRRAGVVAIAHPDAVGLAALARTRGVDIGGYPWGVARIDPHVFNDEADVDAFVDVFRAFAGT